MAIYKSKAVTKNGRKWYFSVCYLTANGERKRKKSQQYATKPEAQIAERQFLIDKTHDTIDITFEEMYYQYLDYTEESIKGSSKYSKVSRIENHILPYLGQMNIHRITVNMIMAWKSKINRATYDSGKKKYALSYKKNLMQELRAILKYGVDFCGLKENFAVKVMNFQDKNEAVVSDEDRIRYITPIEYNLFTSIIKELVFKVFFAFLYYMGVRKGEAQALTWEDILWDTYQVKIFKTITTKTFEIDDCGFHFKITNTKNRKNRKIQMPSILKNMLLELYEYYKGFEGFNHQWFVFGGYRYLPSESIDRNRKMYFDLVEKTYGVVITRITNHEFRHSHASYLISKGVSIHVIADRLGDTVEVVQKVYAHLFPEAEEGVIEALNMVEDNYKKNLVIKKEFLKSVAA